MVRNLNCIRTRCEYFPHNTRCNGCLTHRRRCTTADITVKFDTSELGIWSSNSNYNHRRCETVNTVCLGFSHEFTQFCQSWFYLQNGVKKVSRITYYRQRLRFFDCGAVFDMPAYFYPGHVTLFCHLTRNQHVYQNQKKEAGNFIKENLGCGAIQNTRFVAQLNISLIHWN